MGSMWLTCGRGPRAPETVRPTPRSCWSAALAAWRGEGLEEFAEVAPLAAEAVALAELRLELTDAWIEARLAAGHDPAAVVGDAARAAAAAPLARVDACPVDPDAGHGRPPGGCPPRRLRVPPAPR